MPFSRQVPLATADQIFFCALPVVSPTDFACIGGMKHEKQETPVSPLNRRFYESELGGEGKGFVDRINGQDGHFDPQGL
jgi:hypothetical protein